jgi:hypothetical protein
MMTRNAHRRLLLHLGSAVTAVVLLTSALVGCGVTTSPSAAGAGPTSTNSPLPTPTAHQPVVGGASLNGCGAQQAPANAGTRGDVIVHGGGGQYAVGQAAPTTSLRKGQTLEVQLPAGFHWTLMKPSANTVLTAAANNGWYDASLQSCIWRFTAAAIGSASLQYAGRQVCAPGAKCPTFLVEEEFHVAVHA